MRIRFDEQIFAAQTYGGISRYYTILVRELVRLNVDVRIVAPFHVNHYLESLPQGIVCGRKVAKHQPYVSTLRALISQQMARYQLVIQAPSVIHETYYSSRRSGPKRTPVVITIYDMIHEIFPDKVALGDHTARNKCAAVSRASHVICISENTRNDFLERFDFPHNQTSVIHLGVDIPENGSVGDAKPASGAYLLYVGDRTAPYKNFPLFLQAIAASSSLKQDFEIVAFGGGGFTAGELALIHSLDLNVRSVNGSDRVLSCLYKCAAALVYPSLYEGFGMPPLEAMAHRCPVVSSDTSSMPEVLGNAAQYFDPTSIDAIRDAIENVVYSTSKTKALIDLGQERASRFRWEFCAKQTLDVYRQVSA